MVAIAMGIAAALAIISIADSGALAIQRDFERLGATDVTARFRSDLRDAELTWPSDVDDRLATLAGVAGGGVLGPLPRVSVERYIGLQDPAPPVEADAYALSEGAMKLLVEPDPPHWTTSRENGRVILLGHSVAAQLGIGSVDHPTVFVDGISHTVIGVVERAQRRPELLDGVIIPRPPKPTDQTTDDADTEIVVETTPGWAQHVGALIPTALLAGHPERVEVTVEPEPRRLADAVNANTRSLVLSVAGIALLAGLLAISNSVSASVVERIPELALRRVFGARSSHLQRHVLTESALVGVFSGLAGVVLGWCATMIVIAHRGWEPVVNRPLWLLAPILGACCGVIAGAIPAWRAGRIQPADGIRRE